MDMFYPKIPNSFNIIEYEQFTNYLYITCKKNNNINYNVK